MNGHNIKLGDRVYREINFNDGRGWVPQVMKVVELRENRIVCDVPNGNSVSFIADDDGKSYYLNRGECFNKCCKLNGYEDAFDCYCKSMGVRDSDREFVKVAQMQLHGVETYEELLKVME